MQTSFSQDPSAALAGMIADARSSDVISRTLSTKQLYELTFSTTDGTYTVSINGTQVASYVASSATAAAIRDDILADIQASSAPVVATASSTNKILLEALGYTDDDEFTVSIATVTGFSATQLIAQAQEVPFGLGVCADDQAAVSGDRCRLPRQSTDITTRFLGVAKRDAGLEPNDSGVIGWPNGSRMSIVRRGAVWVVTETALSELAQVYCRYSASGSEQLGAFRNDADTSDAALVPGMRCIKAVTGAGIALCEVGPST